jgi:DNA-binding IclR family transcriptional regulator
MQVIEKQLILLEAIAELKNENGFSIADLVDKTGFNSSAIHRICSILVKRGYLFHKHKRSKYLISQKFLLFSGINKYALGIKEQALPFLERLSKETSETVDLLIFDGTSLFSMATILPKQFLRAVPDTANAQPFPLHCTAIGKMLLASLSDEKFETVIANTVLTANTDNTILDKDQLRSEIDVIRHEGIAYDIEEFFEGVMSVAAPIKNDTGVIIGTISIVGPSIRIDTLKLKQFAPVAGNYALQISRSLGYKGT